MSVHTFQCFIGLGTMGKSDLETRMADWVSSTTKWSNDASDNEVHEDSTDDSGTTFYTVSVKFEKVDTKENIVQKFEDKLKDKVDWYRVGYHNCNHDESVRTSCQWDDVTEWTVKDVSIPSGIPNLV